MKKRFDAYGKTLYDFINNIYVVCPHCSKQAIVQSEEFSKRQIQNETKLSCPNCGFNKYYKETPREKWVSKSGIVHEINDLVVGKNIDPYFKLPLWIQLRMRDGILWAYNFEHLDFIKSHVEAELRYRDATKNLHWSLGAKLPKWMTLKKNRNEILSAIDKLKRLT
nr:hypothetical protein [uncultured Allomuricauda sp.]